MGVLSDLYENLHASAESAHFALILSVFSDSATCVAPSEPDWTLISFISRINFICGVF